MVVWSGRHRWCCCGVEVDGDGVSFNLGADGEMAEKFHGENPGFEGAFLLTENDAARTGDGEGCPAWTRWWIDGP